MTFLCCMTLYGHNYVHGSIRSTLPNCANIAECRNMSNMTYNLRLCHFCHTSSKIVASTTVAPTIVAYATIFEARRKIGPGQAGWLVAKNLSGFQKSAQCGCAIPMAGYHAQDGVSRQLPADHYNSILRKNLRILATCVKYATFCIISAMRGQA